MRIAAYNGVRMTADAGLDGELRAAMRVRRLCALLSWPVADDVMPLFAEVAGVARLRLDARLPWLWPRIR
jgi:hypothetical protein